MVVDSKIRHIILIKQLTFKRVENDYFYIIWLLGEIENCVGSLQSSFTARSEALHNYKINERFGTKPQRSCYFSNLVFAVITLDIMCHDLNNHGF